MDDGEEDGPRRRVKWLCNFSKFPHKRAIKPLIKCPLVTASTLNHQSLQAWYFFFWDMKWVGFNNIL